MIIKSPIFDEIRKYLKQADTDKHIFLYVPYIKTKILAKLIESLDNKITIITTWEPNDLLTGSSELELYPFCKQKKITLYKSTIKHTDCEWVFEESAILYQ